jgi:hypothetical protein
VDKPFRAGLVSFCGQDFSCRIGCFSLEKSRHEASILQEKCRICDIFLLNNRPKLAENVEKQAEFSDKNERINRQV